MDLQHYLHWLHLETTHLYSYIDGRPSIRMSTVWVQYEYSMVSTV
jgi:hypothetical protein